jgi:putative two-component system response regulator
MARILVVDDQSEARYLLAAMLDTAGHEVAEATNGEEGLAAARRERPALVISDVMMPVMDGFEFCNQVRRDPMLRDLGFVFYSANYTRADERGFAMSLGANAYLEKPNDLKCLLETVASVLQGRPTPTDSLSSDEFWPQHRFIVLRKLEQKVAELERSNAELQAGKAQLRKAMSATVVAIDRIVEYRDPYTAGHQYRVGDLASAIGRELGLDAHRVEGLQIGGYLHDVGKIFAPAEILTRPGRLNEMENAIVRAHSRVGYDILQGLDFPWPVADIALQHHERLDGTGYPSGLRGDEILLEARIVAVADVVEAMANHRPYRPALGIEPALAEIFAGSGSRYDQAVAQACARLFRETDYRLPEYPRAVTSAAIP